MPPTAGSVAWARHLLGLIEPPMRSFSLHPAVTSLHDYGMVVKDYNRLARALAGHEAAWLAHWKGGLEGAAEGLRATLFVLDPASGELVVNCDLR